jgi:hypothetical protein
MILKIFPPKNWIEKNHFFLFETQVVWKKIDHNFVFSRNTGSLEKD